MNFERQHGDEPMVFLAPDDARTARAAGIAFARALAGAPSGWFMLALDEQELIIREAIQRSGYPAETRSKRPRHSTAAHERSGAGSPVQSPPWQGMPSLQGAVVQIFWTSEAAR